MEPIVDREKYVFHGLSGYIENEEKTIVDQSEENNIKAAIIEEIAAYDPYYDMAHDMKIGFYTFSIVRTVKDIDSAPILFGLYRLIQILKYRKIETFDDIKKRPGSLVINSGHKLGEFSNSDELCFATPNKNLVNGLSCNTGGSFASFIDPAVAIVLPYDEVFRGYKKSDDLDGIFEEEIRIKGSIDRPNIYAVSLPVTCKIGKIQKEYARLKNLEYWKSNIRFVREILKIFEYPEVHIVDSISGYDLEDEEIMKAYEKVIKGSDGIDEYCDYMLGYDRYSFTNALKEYINRLNKRGTTAERPSSSQIWSPRPNQGYNSYSSPGPSTNSNPGPGCRPVSRRARHINDDDFEL